MVVYTVYALIPRGNNMKAIIYTRVSTAEQSKSGLGLASQLTACNDFCSAEGFAVVGHFEETQTGKGADALDRRPVLRKALALARKESATLVVAKLDRLSRNVAFISTLMESRTPICCTAGSQR